MKIKGLKPAPMEVRAKKGRAAKTVDIWGGQADPVQDSEDLQRVLALPRRPPVEFTSLTAQAIVERETAKYRKDRTGMGPCECQRILPGQACITQLFPIQAVMLREMGMAGGLFSQAPVSAGKTLAGLLALLALGLRREKREQGLLLVPANLINQICDDYRLYSQHWEMPSIVVHIGVGKDFVCTVPGRPILHVMSHNAVSSPRDSTYIENLKPAVVIIDEADAFSALTSARTIRLRRLMDEAPQTKMCVWSGSMADKSMMEFWHLMMWCLKENAPVPLDQDEAESWAGAIDVTERPRKVGALMQLVEDCDDGEVDRTRVRSAFYRRMSDTLGVVIGDTSEIKVTGADGKFTDQAVKISIGPREGIQIPEIIQRALDKVRDFERPDTLAGAEHDDPIEDILMMAKYAREVACGMFYYSAFPRGEPRELIDEYYEAKSEYFKERREKLIAGERYLDSPKLCELAAMRYHGDLPPGQVERRSEHVIDPETGEPMWDDHDQPVLREVVVDNRHLPEWPSECWPRWRDVKDKVVPVQRAYRLHPFLVEDAAQWALERPGIVWYSMVELGQWIAELSGLPLMSGGPDAGARLKAELQRPVKDARSIIASIKSHGRGRNGMQLRFDRQYVINTLTSNKLWEQLCGRTVRNGQRSTEVTTEVCLHTPELEKAFYENALSRADFVQEIWRQTQKLRQAIPNR